MAIYCMSGTGNSYSAAKTLSDTFGLDVINIVRLKTSPQGVVTDSDDLIGFVFPIYDFDAPKIVYERLRNIEIKSSAYVFAIGTYGVGTLGAFKKMNKRFQDAHFPLHAAFGLPMPHNAVGSSAFSDEEIEKRLALSELTLQKIIHAIENKTTGDHLSTKGISLLLVGTLFKMLPSTLPLIKTILLEGVDALQFIADTRCVHCGVCEQICPNDNITLVNGRPVFDDRCLNCFACIQWCSASAISFGGKRLGLAQYTHPKVTVSDMITFNRLE